MPDNGTNGTVGTGGDAAQAQAKRAALVAACERINAEMGGGCSNLYAQLVLGSAARNAFLGFSADCPGSFVAWKEGKEVRKGLFGLLLGLGVSIDTVNWRECEKLETLARKWALKQRRAGAGA